MKSNLRHATRAEQLVDLRKDAATLISALSAVNNHLTHFHHSAQEDCWKYSDMNIDEMTMRTLLNSLRFASQLVDDTRYAMGLLP